MLCWFQDSTPGTTECCAELLHARVHCSLMHAADMGHPACFQALLCVCSGSASLIRRLLSSTGSSSILSYLLFSMLGSHHAARQLRLRTPKDQPINACSNSRLSQPFKGCPILDKNPWSILEGYLTLSEAMRLGLTSTELLSVVLPCVGNRFEQMVCGPSLIGCTVCLVVSMRHWVYVPVSFCVCAFVHVRICILLSRCVACALLSHLHWLLRQVCILFDYCGAPETAFNFLQSTALHQHNAGHYLHSTFFCLSHQGTSQRGTAAMSHLQKVVLNAIHWPNQDEHVFNLPSRETAGSAAALEDRLSAMLTPLHAVTYYNSGFLKYLLEKAEELGLTLCSSCSARVMLTIAIAADEPEPLVTSHQSEQPITQPTGIGNASENSVFAVSEHQSSHHGTDVFAINNMTPLQSVPAVEVARHQSTESARSVASVCATGLATVSLMDIACIAQDPVGVQLLLDFGSKPAPSVELKRKLPAAIKAILSCPLHGRCKSLCARCATFGVNRNEVDLSRELVGYANTLGKWFEVHNNISTDNK